MIEQKTPSPARASADEPSTGGQRPSDTPVERRGAAYWAGCCEAATTRVVWSASAIGWRLADVTGITHDEIRFCPFCGAGLPTLRGK